MIAMRSRAAAALVAGCLAAGAAPLVSAGEAQDRLFELGVLDAVETGQRLVYVHTRSGSAADAATLPPIADGRVELSLVQPDAAGARTVEVALRDGAQLRSLTPFPAGAGNPLLMIFMETSVRSMATATGGSPFYIRNRMREALRTQDEGSPVAIEADGRTVEGRRFAFRPFVGDPNAAQMGAFADLEISFVISEAVPGRYALLEAVAGPDAQGEPALRETITYQSTEAER